MKVLKITIFPLLKLSQLWAEIFILIVCNFDINGYQLLAMLCLIV